MSDTKSAASVEQVHEFLLQHAPPSEVVAIVLYPLAAISSKVSATEMAVELEIIDYVQHVQHTLERVLPWLQELAKELAKELASGEGEAPF